MKLKVMELSDWLNRFENGAVMTLRKFEGYLYLSEANSDEMYLVHEPEQPEQPEQEQETRKIEFHPDGVKYVD